MFLMCLCKLLLRANYTSKMQAVHTYYTDRRIQDSPIDCRGKIVFAFTEFMELSGRMCRMGCFCTEDSSCLLIMVRAGLLCLAFKI